MDWLKRRWYRHEVLTPYGHTVSLPYRKARQWPSGHRRLVKRRLLR